LKIKQYFLFILLKGLFGRYNHEKYVDPSEFFFLIKFLAIFLSFIFYYLFQVQEAKSVCVLQATVLMEDALHLRSIFHKVEKNALIVYRCYYSRPIQT